LIDLISASKKKIFKITILEKRDTVYAMLPYKDESDFL